MIFNPVRYGGGSVKTKMVTFTIRGGSIYDNDATLYYTVSGEAKTLNLGVFSNQDTVSFEADAGTIAYVVVPYYTITFSYTGVTQIEYLRISEGNNETYRYVFRVDA